VSDAPVLSVRDLRVHYGTVRGTVRAVDRVSFDIGAAEVLGLVGESGCGKSTLGRGVLGLLPEGAASDGQVLYGGRNLVGLSPRQLSGLRGPELGLIFQEPMTRLNPLLRIEDHFKETLEQHEPQLTEREIRQRSLETLGRMGIPPTRFRQYPHEFSGGMRQRIMIALALVLRPKLLVADEPTTSLDVIVEAQILAILADLKRNFGTALLLITHNLGIIAEACDRVAVMYAGKIVEEGPARDVFADPAHPYTRELLRSTISLETTELHSIPGAPPNLIDPPPGCHFHPRCPDVMRVCSWKQPVDVAPGPDLDPYIQDALEEIEYVTGSTSTRWGAERAKDGHPAPFHLSYVEIGNEDWFDKSGSYDGRYAQFYKAIKAKYPDLQLIATTPVKGIRPDIVDDHYYRTAQQFFDDVHHYDATDRNGPKIMVGEWATREGSPTTNLGAALGDAAWMTGMERNSDIVVLASYAPLFVNVNPGGMQWPSDLIGYDAFSSYGSPSYYAQVMFSTHLGDQILESKLDTANPRLFDSVTYDSKTHHLILKLVNASSKPQPVKIDLGGAKRVHAKATLTTLSGKSTQATNSITDPKRIVPVVTTIDNAAATFTHTVPRYAIQILNLEVN